MERHEGLRHRVWHHCGAYGALAVKAHRAKVRWIEIISLRPRLDERPGAGMLIGSAAAGSSGHENLAPVELKRFARRKGQPHEDALPGGLLQPFVPPPRSHSASGCLSWGGMKAYTSNARSR